ncbi:MAG: sialidase family protein [Victivallales bacterium]|jgi:predicted neuraminidase
MMGVSINWRFSPAGRIFKAGPVWSYGREPVLRRMPDGDLYCLIYSGGIREPAPTNVVLGSRSSDDGATWSQPETLWSLPDRAVWGTELFTETERPFTIFQTFIYETHYCELRAFISRTADSGRTWEEPVSIPGVPPNLSVRQGKVLSDGSWVFPVYWCEVKNHWNHRFDLSSNSLNDRRDWRFVSGIIRSTDQGKKFSLHGSFSADVNLWEPEVIEAEPGHLIMFIRPCLEYFIRRADSYDYGQTWSEAVPTDIPTSGSKIATFKINGKILLINNTDTTLWQRKSLDLWVSSDNAETWESKITLAQIPEGCPARQVAYPHGFADEERQTLYLAVDTVDEFELLKIPYSEIV